MRRLCNALTSVEWLILLAILPFILFPTPQRSLALLIIPLLWLLRKWIDGRFLSTTPLDTSLLLISLTLLISLYATYDLNLSLPKVIGVVYGIALFYAITKSTSQSPRRLLIGLAVFLLVGFAIILVSLIGTSWGAKLPGFSSLVSRIPLLINNIPGAADGFSPNEVAGTLLWFLPVSLVLALAPLTFSRQLSPSRLITLFFSLFLGSLALLGIATLLLTQSRSGYLAFTAASPVIAWGLLHRRKWLFAMLFIFMMTLGITVLSLVGWPTTSQFFLAFANDTMANPELTLTGRTEIWERALFAIQDFPLTGMGMNLFRTIVPVLYPFFALSNDIDIAHAHNQFLQAAVDLGLPGLIAYLALWLGLASMLWQSWRLSPALWSRFLTAAFAASLTASFVFGLTDAVALGAKPGFMFWFLLGLISGHYQLVTRGNIE